MVLLLLQQRCGWLLRSASLTLSQLSLSGKTEAGADLHQLGCFMLHLGSKAAIACPSTPSTACIHDRLCCAFKLKL